MSISQSSNDREDSSGTIIIIFLSMILVGVMLFLALDNSELVALQGVLETQEEEIESYIKLEEEWQAERRALKSELESIKAKCR